MEDNDWRVIFTLTITFVGKGMCTVEWELDTISFISKQVSSKSDNCSTKRQDTKTRRGFHYRTGQRMDRVLSQYNGTTATYRAISGLPQAEHSHKNSHEREKVILHPAESLENPRHRSPWTETSWTETPWQIPPRQRLLDIEYPRRDPLDRDPQTDTPWTETPRQIPPGQRPLDRNPLDRDSLDRDPWKEIPWIETPHPRDWHLVAATMMWYVSYWNAYLFLKPFFSFWN